MNPLAPSAPAALQAAYAGLTALVGELGDADLLLPTACRGWTVSDLLLHVLGDAQRALVTLHTPAPGPATTDFISYWCDFPGTTDDAAAAHGQWVRRTAAAYQRPSGVVERWIETAPAAVHAARHADPSTFVATQGHVLAVPDFLATLVTEAVIHHLDLSTALPGAAEPAAEAVAVARSTMDGLAGPEGLPSAWSPLEALLKSAGRQPLSPADRRTLGEEAGLFPLLG